MPKSLNVTGGRLVFDEFGDGPKTIVFVHDPGGNLLSRWNQIALFRGRFRCITHEVRGWGRRQDLSDEGRTAVSRDLGELMDHLQIPRAALVGQTISGFFACRSRDEMPIAYERR